MLILIIAALIAGPTTHKPAAPPAADAQEQLPVEQLSQDELRARIQSYLGVIDRPIPSAQWKALGPQAAPLLEEIIADPHALPSRRAVAVDGLVAAAPDRAAVLAPQLAQSEEQPVTVRAAAMHGATRVLAGPTLIAALQPVMAGARHPGLRRSAAELLAQHGHKAGCAAVRAQAQREEQGAFDHALLRCE